MSTIPLIPPVSLLALDCDGVLTDGCIYQGANEFLLRFNVKDGRGIRSLMAKGIPCVVISGRSGAALMERCRGLGITEVHTGIEDKLTLAREIARRLKIDLSKWAYMGDDEPDLELLGNVALPAAPADAARAVREACAFVSDYKGGEGAVRELTEIILRSLAFTNG